ncbi:hypothetical protein A5766_00140 [Gordonia sp. 852002-51296_SCH5728562-b]|nr:hypothetical protein A5766_00140 [Gordonia sp. 852002-51296_SCH5728562-b]
MKLLLTPAVHLAAIVTILFVIATVFALVSFGVVFWWQPLSAIVFGGVWYGLSRLRARTKTRTEGSR